MFGTVIFLQVRSFHFTTLITIKTVHTINNGVYPNSRIQNTDVLHGSSERVRQRTAGQPRPPGPQQAGPTLWPAASQGTPSRRGVILAISLASIQSGTCPPPDGHTLPPWSLSVRRGREWPGSCRQHVWPSPYPVVLLFWSVTWCA